MRRMFCKNQRSRAIECLLTESHIHGNMYVWFGGRHGETSHRNMVWRPVSNIDRHHVHIVTVNVDENGRRLNCDFLFRRSDRIRRELEEKYGLRPAERRSERLENPLRGVDVSAGDVKRQVGNTVKAVCRQYRFQTMGEYRALLSLYNVTVEETQGNVRGREYRGLVYSATDGDGNKVGNPFKSSLFGKTVGYDAVQKKFVRSGQDIRDRKPYWEKRMTRRSSFPGSKRRASTPCCATRRKDASTAPPSSTTAPAVCSTAHAWARKFPQMPCRNISPCRMQDSRRSGSPFRRKNARRLIRAMLPMV